MASRAHKYRKAVWLGCVLVLSGCAGGPDLRRVVISADSPQYDGAFWSTWSDGQAELTSYDLTYPRYGALRKGTAVAIFVTETFANADRIKADPGRRAPSDQFPVMKLNLIENFQTGIYDYNLQISTFVALESVNARPAGASVKVTWSSQEWCGNLFKSAIFNESSIRVASFSYFDGEADQSTTMPYPEGGISEDALMLWARGMARPVLKPGERKQLPMMISLQLSRFDQGPARWDTVELTRSAETQNSNGIEVETYTATVGNRSRTYLVEKAPPHRVVEYSTSDGVLASMLASERMKYWEMNTPDGVKQLEKLKLRSLR